MANSERNARDIERVGRVNTGAESDLADPVRRGTVEETGTVTELDERGGAVAGAAVGAGAGAAMGAAVAGPAGALVGGVAGAAAAAAAGALGAASQTGDPDEVDEPNDREVPGANPQRPLSDAERVQRRMGVGGGSGGSTGESATR